MGVPDLISAPAMAREAGIESHISQVSGERERVREGLGVEVWGRVGCLSVFIGRVGSEGEK